MQAISLIDDDVHLSALRKAREIGTDPNRVPGKLYADLPDDERDLVERLWGKVDHIFRLAWDQGAAMARAAIDELGIELNRLSDEIGRQAEKVKAAVKARVSAYVQQLIDGALAQVRESITVGSKLLHVSKITVQQNVKFSGSLKLSVEGVCEFVSNGELAISADYANASA